MTNLGGIKSMTVEEAMKQIESAIITGMINNVQCSALKMAIAALEFQIARKPVNGEYGHKECPSCGWIVESFCGDIEQYPFCPNCGHAILWEEDDDTQT